MRYTCAAVYQNCPSQAFFGALRLPYLALQGNAVTAIYNSNLQFRQSIISNLPNMATSAVS